MHVVEYRRRRPQILIGLPYRDFADAKKKFPGTPIGTQHSLPFQSIYPLHIFTMPSEKAMAKSAKITKASVNEKRAKKVSDSDEETSSDGTSSSGSDDDATSSSGSDSGSESESDSEDEDLPTEIAKPTYVSARPCTFRRNSS